MPVDMKHLAGLEYPVTGTVKPQRLRVPVSGDRVAEETATDVPIVSRTKDGRTAVSPDDRVGWRLVPEKAEREEVLRSPLSDAEWITPAERLDIIRTMKAFDLVFTSRRGFTVFVDAKPGDTGWKHVTDPCRHKPYRPRVCHMLTSEGEWVRVLHRDDEFVIARSESAAKPAPLFAPARMAPRDPAPRAAVPDPVELRPVPVEESGVPGEMTISGHAISSTWYL